MEATQTGTKPVRLATHPDDYSRFKIQQGSIEQW